MHPSCLVEAERFKHDYLASLPPFLSVGDVGSYDVNGSLRPVFSEYVYTGLDVVSGPNVDVVLPDSYAWLGVKQFDVVVSANTAEHVKRVWDWTRSLASILRPGGLLWMHSAGLSIGYHENPVDCWRMYPEGMRALLEYAGLEVLEAFYAPLDTIGIARKP